MSHVRSVADNRIGKVVDFVDGFYTVIYGYDQTGNDGKNRAIPTSNSTLERSFWTTRLRREVVTSLHLQRLCLWPHIERSTCLLRETARRLGHRPNFGEIRIDSVRNERVKMIRDTAAIPMKRPNRLFP